MFHHIRPRDKTNVGRPDIGQSIRRNKTDVGHSRKDQKPQPNTRHFFAPPDGTNQAKIPDGVSPALKIPVKPVYPPIARFLPPYPAKTKFISLYMKKFSRDTAISPKKIGDFFRRFLKRSCPASPANFKQQRDMDDNDGNKKRRQQCAASVFVRGFQSPFFTLTLSFP
ncbi:MAG: hypothetical protein C6P37_14250 [Caldibacillus debilis]|uniref:Uncharacterized protein n=1 Tax=Caldibacillus debilis TaxID=301148 RepID=A0A3E0K0Q5_9BACI|nr:hypothetical protein [Caldibacillus debilis]REJ13466.1 MAG: hypothetical protein C6W57_16340 [Caldibacillus debilis]REJ25900.1 MAG: hypothetical protein C6P37_14250 [Caldibacillus debilis]